ncbi:MAG: hypothetical protein CMM26_06190 [Rhodospirillaceae bacterium]|nr:hypothetical protein [Rhodospirillaceae bacterium]
MTNAIIGNMSPDELVMVVELQRVELNRLLAEQKRLNERVDKLLELQEREQVLRQQMQTSLDHLVRQCDGMAAPEAERFRQDVPLLTDRLNQAERRFHALRAALGQLVMVLERHLTGTSTGASNHGPSGP